MFLQFELYKLKAVKMSSLTEHSPLSLPWHVREKNSWVRAEPELDHFISAGPGASFCHCSCGGNPCNCAAVHDTNIKSTHAHAED